MLRVILLSDTHSYLDPQILGLVESCDEVWHAGDIGSLEVAQKLEAHKPFYAVHGNIDGSILRKTYPKDQWLMREGLCIWMTHIAGRPSSYTTYVREVLRTKTPDILIAGHSHILAVRKDPVHNLLYVNPGAAGKEGIHPKRTLLRFTLHQGSIRDMEAVVLA